MDETVSEEMHSREDMGIEEFEAFLGALTPQARRYALDWLVLPWTIGEMLENEPDGEVVLQELMAVGVIRVLDGVYELYPCDFDWR